MTTYDKSVPGMKITEVGTPDARLLRQWAAAPENTTCWGLDRVADELDRLNAALSNAKRELEEWTGRADAPKPKWVTWENAPDSFGHWADRYWAGCVKPGAHTEGVARSAFEAGQRSREPYAGALAELVEQCADGLVKLGASTAAELRAQLDAINKRHQLVPSPADPYKAVFGIDGNEDGRAKGKSRLVYNKATRTIDKVSTEAESLPARDESPSSGSADMPYSAEKYEAALAWVMRTCVKDGAIIDSKHTAVINAALRAGEAP